MKGRCLELGGLRKAITSRSEALKRFEEEQAQRTKVVEALRVEEAGIKATIRELTEWGQKVIKESQENALSAVQEAARGMAEEIREWGEVRAELGTYLDDLKRARYFTRLPLSSEAPDSYIQDMSPLVVSQGLQLVLSWCLEKLNPKVRPPRWVTQKYYRISEYTDDPDTRKEMKTDSIISFMGASGVFGAEQIAEITVKEIEKG